MLLLLLVAQTIAICWFVCHLVLNNLAFAEALFRCVGNPSLERDEHETLKPSAMSAFFPDTV